MEKTKGKAMPMTMTAAQVRRPLVVRSMKLSHCCAAQGCAAPCLPIHPG